jgi:hypothetical protein
VALLESEGVSRDKARLMREFGQAIDSGIA